jgi:hypothetical protein
LKGPDPGSFVEMLREQSADLAKPRLTLGELFD